jgi:glycosidase
MVSRIVFTVILLAKAFIFGSCIEQGNAESPWPHVVSYEVFVHAFADSDGDGIGDLRGLTQKLDYLNDLGIGAIWMMPIHPSPTYHKYDVTDYRAIHPDYGTMEDFEELIREAHARDIRIILDLVINHSSSEHPWFKEAIADTTSHFYGFYQFASSSDIDRFTVDESETGPDSDNLRRWNKVDSLDDTYYYSYFWSGMPDLNFDNQAVRDSIVAIGHYWLEKGVDGFRLDAAKHIYPAGRESDIHAWWEYFRAEMEKVNPNMLLVGEVWDNVETVKPYLNGLQSLFNFDMGYAMMEAAEKGIGDGLAQRHADVLNAYSEVTDDFIDATFLTNHDQNRVMSVLDNEEKARVAASLLMTLPGAPYIWQGEEIGMRGLKPDQYIREPFLWTYEPDEYRTRWIKPRHSNDKTVIPAYEQFEDPNSILNYYKALIALRNSEPALSIGGLEPLKSENKALSVFVRTHDTGNRLVIHNTGDDYAEYSLDALFSIYTVITFSTHNISIPDNGKVLLPPRSTVILQT